eukprot:TRINITY_DN6272_c1_g1_i1.p1 TRINITY_DN6272_c1_g1~~TRINITY_DN6272_c1_g1_i1.p1  ORF type:complete len:647 (+),score=106.40 TRINITY_DN6272_c1_g1_i1:69-1943(+)
MCRWTAEAPSPASGASTPAPAWPLRAFPPETWAAFAVRRLAEEVAAGELSQWSDPLRIRPASSEVLVGHVHALRKDIAQTLPWGSSRVADAEAVACLAERLEALVLEPGPACDPCGGNPWCSALDCLSGAVVEAFAGRAGQTRIRGHRREQAPPPWCLRGRPLRPSACSSDGCEQVGRRSQPQSPLAAAAPLQQRIAGGAVGGRSPAQPRLSLQGRPSGGLSSTVVAYFASFADCVSTVGPRLLLRAPPRALVSLLPPHLQETAQEINRELAQLRRALMGEALANPASGAGGAWRPPTAATGVVAVAALEATGAALCELLLRLALQAKAADVQARSDGCCDGQPDPADTAAASAREALLELLEHSARGCGDAVRRAVRDPLVVTSSAVSSTKAAVDAKCEQADPFMMNGAGTSEDTDPSVALRELIIGLRRREACAAKAANAAVAELPASIAAGAPVEPESEPGAAEVDAGCSASKTCHRLAAPMVMPNEAWVQLHRRFAVSTVDDTRRGGLASNVRLNLPASNPELLGAAGGVGSSELLVAEAAEDNTPTAASAAATASLAVARAVAAVAALCKAPAVQRRLSGAPPPSASRCPGPLPSSAHREVPAVEVTLTDTGGAALAAI